MNKLNLVFFGLLFLSFAGFSQTTSLPVTKHRCIVIAHRGDHTNAPENTLAAYQHSIEDGADFVEIDLRTTKDSQLVIMHNATIDHMTGRQGQVSDFLFDFIADTFGMDLCHIADLEQAFDTPKLAQLTVVQNSHSIADVLNVCQLVRTHQDRLPLISQAQD